MYWTTSYQLSSPGSPETTRQTQAIQNITCGSLQKSYSLYELARAAVTKCHRLGGLTNRTLLFHGSEARGLNSSVSRAGSF